MTVPGVLDFYGDFRIGGPLVLIGGFNRHLGWATTNSNSGDLTEFYALRRDPSAPDRYLLDGASLPIARTALSVTVRDGDRLVPETRELQSTPLGPVVYVDRTKVYVARTAGDGEYRAGEQFLRMMRAQSLAEWKEAMRIRALVTSNYTYADRAGNIFSLWNAALPLASAPAWRRHRGDAGSGHARSVDPARAVRGAAAAAQSARRLRAQRKRLAALRQRPRTGRISSTRIRTWSRRCSACAASIRSS